MVRIRVTVTLRPDLISAADRKAAAEDRSRSWVFEQALERYLEEGVRAALVVGDTRASWVEGLGPTRQAQLEADLSLSPEERVRHAEDTARVAEVRSRRSARDRIVQFARIEDFFDWSRREGLLS